MAEMHLFHPHLTVYVPFALRAFIRFFFPVAFWLKVADGQLCPITHYFGR